MSPEAERLNFGCQAQEIAPMNIEWYIVHQTGGRTRLKPCAPLGEREVLMELADRLNSLDEALGVIPRPATGSLIIEHPMQNWQRVLPQLQALGLRLGEAPQPQRSHLLSPVLQMMTEVDAAIRNSTEGQVDSRTLMFLIYFLLGVTQLFRGQVLGPAVGLFWFALETLGKIEQERPPSP
jgi:hypothetical protein